MLARPALPVLPFSIPPRLRRAARATALAGAVSAYAIGMGALGLVVNATADIPSLASIAERSRPVSIRFLDRYDRELLVRGGVSAGDVDADTLPAHMRAAILSIEDARFAHHIGVDAEAIARAAVRNFQTGRRGQGGSTLTQQLVKNVFLGPEKTYRRKIQEALLSVAVERTYTKDEVLELYLERVYFGAGLWGLPAAAKGYFGKTPEQLTLPESAMLAGLLKAPSSTNPLADPARAGTRAALVLAKMEAHRHIDRGQRTAALSAPVTVSPPASARGTNHFADWIWPQVEDQLGIVSTDIVIRTTLDADIQAAAEAAVHLHLDADRGAEEAAVVTLDAMGGVLAMVGGRSYADSQFNRATQAERQPGSAFKPFVYLAAIEAGASPWDMRLDAPITVDGWTAENYGDRYFGHVTLAEGFRRSLNTVAVGLSEDVGRERVVATAARFGLATTPLPSIALGAQGSTPLAMAGAYLPFGNWGRRAEPFGLVSITTASGTPLYAAAVAEPVRVVADGPLRDLNALMLGTVARGTGTRARVPGHSVAGKTGTTNDNRDAWFVGVAPGVSTAVWVGNDANTPMDAVTGGSIPASIFANTMAAVLADATPVELPAATKPIWAEPSDPGLDSLLSRIEDALP